MYLPDERGRKVLMMKRTNEHGNMRRTQVRRCGMWGASLLCSVGLFLGGCAVVTKSKHEVVVADMEAAKMELEKSRMRHETLQQENQTLRADHEKAALDLEMLSAEIQRLKESNENERDLLAIRQAEAQRDREARARKLGEIQRVHQRLKSQNRALRDTVRRYQKELKEAREAKVKSAAPASPAIQPKENASTAPPMVAAKRSPKPAPPPVAVPFNGTVSPVNINTASANDLVLFLGLPKAVADQVVSNRPYRLRGELVSKQVVPKATFDVIKDRITAAPQ